MFVSNVNEVITWVHNYRVVVVVIKALDFKLKFTSLNVTHGSN